MAFQNRVTPFGEIVADPARGMLMGNRGILHREDRTLGQSRWRHRRWVTCSLESDGRKRTIMAPGNYTELFFMDEATSFAAGHRPCAECRRSDYSCFRAAWTEGLRLGKAPSAIAIDTLLHARRVQPSRVQILHFARASTLPDGAMFAESGSAFLVWKGRGLRWSLAGYSNAMTLEDRDVAVITPAPTVAALRGGYRPMVDDSAI